MVFHCVKLAWILQVSSFRTACVADQKGLSLGGARQRSGGKKSEKETVFPFLLSSLDDLSFSILCVHVSPAFAHLLFLWPISLVSLPFRFPVCCFPCWQGSDDSCMETAIKQREEAMIAVWASLSKSLRSRPQTKLICFLQSEPVRPVLLLRLLFCCLVVFCFLIIR